MQQGYFRDYHCQIVATPVAIIGDAVGFLVLGRGIAEAAVDFHLGPGIEFALFALAVGIEGAGECRVIPRSGGQFPMGLFDGLAYAGLVECRSGEPPRIGHRVNQQGIVIEHLLEMRCQSIGARGVAREAVAEAILLGRVGIGR